MRYDYTAGGWTCADCGRYVRPSENHYCLVYEGTENASNYIPQGWQCPKCGRVYSPNTFECHHCNQGRFTYHPDSTGTTELTEEELAALRGELAGDNE